MTSRASYFIRKTKFKKKIILLKVTLCVPIKTQIEEVVLFFFSFGTYVRHEKIQKECDNKIINSLHEQIEIFE